MRNIISSTERARNERLKSLYQERLKASQIKKEGVNQGNKPTHLTPKQMEEVVRLRDKEGFSREEAVKMVLSNKNFQ
jgi:predicted DNA-binding protein (UPF0251 family)